MACSAEIDEMVLVRLAQGAKLDESVEGHVAECADCRAVVAALVKGQSRTAPLDDPGEPIAKLLALAPGDRVGRYEVLSCIGAGGMGVVYSAHDPKLDRKVALKIVGRGRSESAHARLMREAQAMARLSHPNVVTVHDVIAHDADVVIAMELVPGDTLDAWLEKPRSWFDIVEVFVEAARGLAAAHEVGLVHRDFKPANVFVRDDGRVQVGDFGLARLQSETPNPDAALTTQPGTLIGTPRYMAPEVHRGEVADARSDQFSFCVALLEALFDLPEDSRAPKLVDDIVQRGLSTDPLKRYPSMSNLIDALESSRMPSLPTFAKPPRRRRWPIFVALAIAAVAGGLVIWRSSSTKPGPRVVTAADRERAAAMLAPAKEHFARGLPGHAADTLARALALDPDLAAARYYRARALHETGAEREARAELERAFSQAAQLPERELLLAKALRLEITGRFVDAEASLQQAAAKFPGDAFVRFDVGDWSFHIGRFDVAERELRAVLQIDPKFAPAHQHLVWTLDNLGRPADAVVAARAWAAALPSKEAQLALIESLVIAGDFEGAAKHLDDLQRTPNAELGFARIDLLIAQNDLRGARRLVDSYNTADANVEVQRGARWSLMWIEGRAGRFSELPKLVEAERAALKPDARTLAMLELIALLWQASRGTDVDVPAITPHDASDYTVLLQTLVEAGDFDRAKQLLESDGSNDPFARMLVDAEQMRRAGRFEDAAALFERTTHGFRNSRILGHYGLARCYFALQRYADALRASEPIAKSHAFRPRGFHSIVYPQAVLLQARAYEKLGDVENARARYRELKALWSEADNDLLELQEVDLALQRLR